MGGGLTGIMIGQGIAQGLDGYKTGMAEKEARSQRDAIDAARAAQLGEFIGNDAERLRGLYDEVVNIKVPEPKVAGFGAAPEGPGGLGAMPGMRRSVPELTPLIPPGTPGAPVTSGGLGGATPEQESPAFEEAEDGGGGGGMGDNGSTRSRIVPTRTYELPGGSGTHAGRKPGASPNYAAGIAPLQAGAKVPVDVPVGAQPKVAGMGGLGPATRDAEAAAHTMDEHVREMQSLQNQIRTALAKAPGKPGSPEYNAYAAKVYQVFESKIEANHSKVQPLVKEASIAKGVKLLNQSLRLVMAGRADDAADLLDANEADGSMFRGATVQGNRLVLGEKDEDGQPITIPIPVAFALQGRDLSTKDALNVISAIYKGDEANASKQAVEKTKADSKEKTTAMIVEGRKAVGAGHDAARITATGITAESGIKKAEINVDGKKATQEKKFSADELKALRAQIQHGINQTSAAMGIKGGNAPVLAQGTLDLIKKLPKEEQAKRSGTIAQLQKVIGQPAPSGGLGGPAPAAAPAPTPTEPKKGAVVVKAGTFS